jgi:hypothetical protein
MPKIFKKGTNYIENKTHFFKDQICTKRDMSVCTSGSMSNQSKNHRVFRKFSFISDFVELVFTDNQNIYHNNRRGQIFFDRNILYSV